MGLSCWDFSLAVKKSTALVSQENHKISMRNTCLDLVSHYTPLVNFTGFILLKRSKR